MDAELELRIALTEADDPNLQKMGERLARSWVSLNYEEWLPQKFMYEKVRRIIGTINLSYPFYSFLYFLHRGSCISYLFILVMFLKAFVLLCRIRCVFF